MCSDSGRRVHSLTAMPMINVGTAQHDTAAGPWSLSGGVCSVGGNQHCILDLLGLLSSVEALHELQRELEGRARTAARHAIAICRVTKSQTTPSERNEREPCRAGLLCDTNNYSAFDLVLLLDGLYESRCRIASGQLIICTPEWRARKILFTSSTTEEASSAHRLGHGWRGPPLRDVKNPASSQHITAFSHTCTCPRCASTAVPGEAHTAA